MIKKTLYSTLTLILLLVLLGSLMLTDRPARAALGERQLAQGAAGDIEYFVSGEGRPVVLIASFARSVSDFNELVPQLNRAGFQTIGVQLRGVDGSDLTLGGTSFHDYAADVAAVIAAEQLQQPVDVIGHAFGNRVARTLASDNPELVNKLVLMAAGGDQPTPKQTSKSISLALFGFWSESARQTAISDAFFAEGNKLVDHWKHGWYPLAGMIQGGATAASQTDSNRDWLTAGRAQLLILQASEDKAAPAEQAGKALAQLIPERSHYVEIAKSGHAMLPEQLALIASHTLKFLSKTEVTLHE